MLLLLTRHDSPLPPSTPTPHLPRHCLHCCKTFTIGKGMLDYLGMALGITGFHQAAARKLLVKLLVKQQSEGADGVRPAAVPAAEHTGGFLSSRAIHRSFPSSIWPPVDCAAPPGGAHGCKKSGANLQL